MNVEEIRNISSKGLVMPYLDGKYLMYLSSKEKYIKQIGHFDRTEDILFLKQFEGLSLEEIRIQFNKFQAKKRIESLKKI